MSPDAIALVTALYILMSLPKSGMPAASRGKAKRYILVAPPSAKVLEMSLLALPIPMANAISVGGTSRFSKEPLMLSLPPIAPSSRLSWACSAPSNAPTGSPHLSGSLPSFLKNSCNVSLIVSKLTPVAICLETAVTIE